MVIKYRNYGKDIWDIMHKSNKIDKEYPRKKGFWEKVRDKFFLILLLFIISSCSQKRDPKNNYLFTRIEIQFIDSCIEDVNIVSYEDEEYIKDSVIRTIDFLKDSLYLYHYRKKKGKLYELKEKRQ